MLLARFLFDYGGTLIPHGKSAGSRDLERLVSVLSRLTQYPDSAVYVISGRTQPNVERDLGSIPNLGLR